LNAEFFHELLISRSTNRNMPQSGPWILKTKVNDTNAWRLQLGREKRDRITDRPLGMAVRVKFRP
jgi:hypothetical protein